VHGDDPGQLDQPGNRVCKDDIGPDGMRFDQSFHEILLFISNIF
jgi:hypothetical protein